MAKYIKNYKSVIAATSDVSIVSPNVTYVTDGTNGKLLMIDCGDDTPIQISGSTLADLVIKEKPIPKMVDLGLPSGNLWAKCNIGADTETGYGKYFAWGDAEGFEASEVSGDMFGLFWYDESRPGGGLTDNILDDDATHNAAFKAYGIGYTMPSKDDFQELIDETENEWVADYNGSGVSGFKFTANNNTLFIPAAGSGSDGSIICVGDYGQVWSTSLMEGHTSYSIDFGESYINIGEHMRWEGFNVRAIKLGTPHRPEMVDLGLTSGTLWSKCNIGASSETKYGKYFAWGDAEGFLESEVTDKFTSDWYASRPGATLTGNIADNDATHNAAFAAYGEGYTMPSQADFQELIDETENEWVSSYNGSGVRGWKFTANNNTLFIPAAGCASEGDVEFDDFVGLTWSSSLYNGDSASSLYFENGGDVKVTADFGRSYGMPIHSIQKPAQ